MKTIPNVKNNWPCVATSPNGQPGFRCTQIGGQWWVEWANAQQIGNRRKQVILWFNAKVLPR